MSKNQISISQKYPAAQYNLLGNTDCMAIIPDIQSPVVQAVRLDTDPKKGDVYIQQKAKNEYTDNNGYHPAVPAKYAITKNGLKKLADGAGIKMLSSEHVIPTTCQKCVAVNQHSGKVVQCGNCNNQDVAYKVTISVPQLTGEVLTVEDTHEINVKNTTAGMSQAQRSEFMKHLPQICEAKALNGAIRTALHIKGTYTIDELQKPFVVAYLVPNLNHEDVKKAAIDNMFNSSSKLFGMAPNIAQIESKVSDKHFNEISDNANIDQYVDGTYVSEQAVEQSAEEQPPSQFFCEKCGEPIQERVYDYSVEHYEMPLCYKCQKTERRVN